MTNCLSNVRADGTNGWSGERDWDAGPFSPVVFKPVQETGSKRPGLLYSASLPAPFLAGCKWRTLDCWVQSRFRFSLEKNLRICGGTSQAFTFFKKKRKKCFWWKCPSILWLCLSLCSGSTPWCGWWGCSLQAPVCPPTGFLLPPQKPNRAKCAQCLKLNVPSLASYFHTSYCLCPLRGPWPPLHSVTQCLQAHTGMCTRTTALRLTHLNPLP